MSVRLLLPDQLVERRTLALSLIHISPVPSTTVPPLMTMSACMGPIVAASTPRCTRDGGNVVAVGYRGQGEPGQLRVVIDAECR